MEQKVCLPGGVDMEQKVCLPGGVDMEQKVCLPGGALDGRRLAAAYLSPKKVLLLLLLHTAVKLLLPHAVEEVLLLCTTERELGCAHTNGQVCTDGLRGNFGVQKWI